MIKLRMPKFVLIVGLLCSLLAIAVLLWFIISPKHNFGALPGVLLTFLVFGGCGTFLILYGLNHSLMYDETHLEVKSLLGKVKSLQWSEVTSISYDSKLKFIIIRSIDSKIKIDDAISGLKEFLKYLEQKTALKLNEDL
jgi:hypothetical protein